MHFFLAFQILIGAKLILNLLDATKPFHNHWMIIYWRREIVQNHFAAEYPSIGIILARTFEISLVHVEKSCRKRVRQFWFTVLR